MECTNTILIKTNRENYRTCKTNVLELIFRFHKEQ